MSRGFPSMTALLGLLAIAGYQNRDKIAEMLRGRGQNEPGAEAQGGIGGLLAQLGLGGANAGGILGGGLDELMERFKQSGQSVAAGSSDLHRQGPFRTGATSARSARSVPGARLVNCRRDPVENCLACFRQSTSQQELGFTYDLAEIASFWRDYDRLMRAWHRRFPAWFTTSSTSSSSPIPKPRSAACSISAACRSIRHASFPRVERNVAPRARRRFASLSRRYRAHGSL